MPLKEVQLLLLVAVAILLFISTTDSHKNMTTQLNPDLGHSSIVNTSHVEYNAPENIEPDLIKYRNNSRIKISNDMTHEDNQNDINLKNEDKYDTERIGTISAKRSEHGHHKDHKKHNHHKHKEHHSGKAHKNKYDQIAPQPKVTKKNREATTKPPPKEYGSKEAGEDWSCGLDLNLRCCEAVKEDAGETDLIAKDTGKLCRCRCKAMPIKWGSKLETAEFETETDDNNGFEYCKNSVRGWATLDLGTAKRKKSGRP